MTVVRSIATGAGPIEFTLRRSRRRTLAIHVHPDGSVEVVAPEGVASEAVDTRVTARAGWIRRQQTYFDDLRPRTPARRYVPGETHLYLGRRFRLRVEDGPTSVSAEGSWINISVPSKTPEQVSVVLAHWRRQKAALRLPKRLDEIATRLRIPHETRPRLVIRSMRTRWASLSRGGTLTVNPDLIRAPMACIDYVLVHELCHLNHPNHGPAFWRLLARRMPDWQARKRRLERALA